MKNKSTIIGIWLGAMSTLGITGHLYTIVFDDSEWTLKLLYWLIPVSYSVFLMVAENEKSIWRQHIKLFDAAVDVFKRKA